MLSSTLTFSFASFSFSNLTSRELFSTYSSSTSSRIRLPNSFLLSLLLGGCAQAPFSWSSLGLFLDERDALLSLEEAMRLERRASGSKEESVCGRPSCCYCTKVLKIEKRLSCCRAAVRFISLKIFRLSQIFFKVLEMISGSCRVTPPGAEA